MTETQERFLKVIAAHVPPERVVELHLFTSLRQGAVESGVAVVAAEPTAAGISGSGAGADDGATAGQRDTVAEAACDPTEQAAGATPGAQPFADSAREAADSLDSHDGAPRGDVDRSPPLVPAAHRLTIYTARYRLLIKGPDRGKWEASVSAEADAPLVTLEAVVRGVRHRAGDGADSERLSGDEFRAALAAPAWITST